MAIFEIFVATFDQPGRRSDGGERTKEGDIIAVREPKGTTGPGEKHGVWVKIETNLTHEELQEPGPDGEKRRRRIDVARLATDEGIDIRRLRDPNDHYQPLLERDVKAEGAVPVETKRGGLAEVRRT